jgi:NCS1 family nucleobase:cation symporter-1
MQPWKLLADPKGYIFTWLFGYSAALGSIAGVLIADYWVVRRKELRLEDLYLSGGAYRYSGGWNWTAVAATLLGCFLAWAGSPDNPLRMMGLPMPVIGWLTPLAPYAWFVAFGSAFALYALLMRRRQSSCNNLPDSLGATAAEVPTGSDTAHPPKTG